MRVPKSFWKEDSFLLYFINFNYNNLLFLLAESWFAYGRQRFDIVKLQWQTRLKFEVRTSSKKQTFKLKTLLNWKKNRNSLSGF